MTEPMLIGLALVAIDRLDRYLRRTGGATGAAWALAALVLTRYEGWLSRCRPAACHRVCTGARGPPDRSSALAASLRRDRPVPRAELGQHRRVVRVVRILRPGVRVAPQPGDVFGTMRDGRPRPDRPVVALRLPPAERSCALFASRAVAHRPCCRCAARLRRRRCRWSRSTRDIRSACATSCRSLLRPPALTGLGDRRSCRQRAQAIAAVLLVGRRPGRTRPPLDHSAPMVIEAQWEIAVSPRPRTGDRAARLHRDDGSPILASMGSLGHYMQEASRAGFALRRFPARRQRRPVDRGAQTAPADPCDGF